MRRRNLACSRVPSLCRSWVGSFVDRSHRCEENHFIQVFERKQTCRKQLWTLDGRTVGRAADGARPPSDREHGAAGLRTFTYTNPLRGQSSRLSTQRNRHGAFKPKPRYARFRLVINKQINVCEIRALNVAHGVTKEGQRCIRRRWCKTACQNIF